MVDQGKVRNRAVARCESAATLDDGLRQWSWSGERPGACVRAFVEGGGAVAPRYVVILSHPDACGYKDQGTFGWTR